MKIGIHHKEGSFSDRWIAYCEEKGIPWKKVDCYCNDIMWQLDECDALMWHINQNNPKEILFAKQLIYSVMAAGKQVFPDYKTNWHFDDKVGQKYLLEAIGAPIPETWIFYDKLNAYHWAEHASYPKVFKLRGGAGSQNVRLVNTQKEAKRIMLSETLKIAGECIGWGGLIYGIFLKV
jgi:glutathione synthase/RimK-type ligase-like ATP-grasp enzyme